MRSLGATLNLLTRSCQAYLGIALLSIHRKRYLRVRSLWAMTREALDIILRLWSAETTFDYKGTYWHVTKAPEMFGLLRPHLRPLQQLHPPIGVAGLSKGSDTLRSRCSRFLT